MSLLFTFPRFITYSRILGGLLPPFPPNGAANEQAEETDAAVGFERDRDRHAFVG